MNERAKNLIKELENYRNNYSNDDFIFAVNLYIDIEEVSFPQNINTSKTHKLDLEEHYNSYYLDTINELKLYKNLHLKLPPRNIKTKFKKI